MSLVALFSPVHHLTGYASFSNKLTSECVSAESQQDLLRTRRLRRPYLTGDSGRLLKTVKFPLS